MARRREGIIHESISQLETLAGRYHGSDREMRIRMLLMFSRNPEARNDDVAMGIARSEKTVRRWWHLYRIGGLDGLLYDDRSSPGNDASAFRVRNEPRISAPVRAFLNSLPTTRRTIEWIEAMRDGLQTLLGDVDRIMVDVNLNCDPDDPDGDEDALNITQHVMPKKDRRGKPDVTTTRSKRSPGALLVERVLARKIGDYQKPRYFEYFLDGKSYLGTIILWRERSKAPISRGTLETMESLEPFLIFLLSDCVARGQQNDPDLRAFKEVVEAIGLRIGLTRREMEIFILQMFGNTHSNIAEQLGIRTGTVGKHICSIHSKAGTHNYSELFARFFTPLRDD